jgi:hypothetical protein
MRWLRLEGGGDLGAAFLKDHGPQNYEQPQGGEKGEGAKRCNHCVHPSWSALTELD